MSTKTAINYKISVKKTKSDRTPFEVSLYIERASSKFLRLSEGPWNYSLLGTSSSSILNKTRITSFNCIFPTTVGKAVKTTSTCAFRNRKLAIDYAHKLQESIRTRARRAG